MVAYDFDGWEDLDAPGRRRAAPKALDGVTACPRLRKTGGASLHLFLQANWADRWGEMKAATAKAGRGADIGLLRLWFGAGPIKVYLGGRQHRSLRLGISAPSWFGAVAAGPVKLKVLEVFDDGLLLEFPKPGAQRATGQPRRPAAARDETHDLTAPVCVQQELNGRAVKRLSGDRWQVDGDVYTPEAVAILINKLRKRANMPPITSSQLRDGDASRAAA